MDIASQRSEHQILRDVSALVHGQQTPRAYQRQNREPGVTGPLPRASSPEVRGRVCRRSHMGRRKRSRHASVVGAAHA